MKKIINEIAYIFNKKQKKSMLLLLVAVFIGAVFELLGVSLFSPLLSVISEPEKIDANPFLYYFRRISGSDDIQSLFILLALVIIVIYIVKNIYLCALYYFLYSFIYRNQLKVESRLVDCYLRKPYVYHLDHNTSDLIRNIMLDSERLFQLVLMVLNVTSEIMLSVLLILYLIITDPVMTLSIAAILLISVGLYSGLTRKKVNRYGMINQEYDGRMHQSVEEALGSVKDIKILHREKFFVDRFTDCGEAKMDALIHTNFFGTIPKYLIEMACVAGMLTGIICKAVYGTDINSLVPELAAFAVAAFKLLPSVGKIANLMNGISFLKPSIDIIYNDLKDTEDMSQNEVKDESSPPDTQDAVSVEIKDISFAYPNTEHDVLDCVSISIPVGSSVGLIGTTGSGKTTMADIILGILFPKKGAIFFGDMNVHDYPLTWASKLAYIPQAIFLSDDTIRANIAYGIESSKIDEDKVWKAADEAQLAGFIRTLPEGLDTKVGERGVRLSGGQRQRIGIARALYGDPEFLVLDEATSALDSDTEQAVMEAIDSMKGRKTMIIIAHRLTTIKNCDMIFEVKNGKAKKVERKDFEKALKEQIENE